MLTTNSPRSGYEPTINKSVQRQKIICCDIVFPLKEKSTQEGQQILCLTAFLTATLAPSTWAIFGTDRPRLCLITKQAVQAVTMSAFIFDLIVLTLTISLPTDCSPNKGFLVWILIAYGFFAFTFPTLAVYCGIWEHRLRVYEVSSGKYMLNEATVLADGFPAVKPYKGTAAATSAFLVLAALMYMMSPFILQRSPSITDNDIVEVDLDESNNYTN